MSQSQQYDKLQYAGQASAYATEGTSYTELARAQNTRFNANNNFIYDRGLGEGFNAVKTYYGPMDVNGSTSFFVTDFDFLKHWVGPKSGAGTSGDHYKLTEASKVDVSTSYLQPFSVERLNDTEDTDSVEVQIGCVGQNFSLNGEMGERLKCDCNWIAREPKYRTTHETYTVDTSSSYIMLGGTWKWGSTPSALSGVRSFTLNYKNGLVVDTRSIESRFINQPLLGERTYTVSVSIIMSSALAATIINDFYGSVAGGVYSPEDGSTSISPTSNLEFKVELVNGDRYATIWLDQCSIDDISLAGSLSGGLKILQFNITAREGRGNVPIEWWTA